MKLAIENCDTGLAKKMVGIADAEGLPDDHAMRVRADDFERAVLDVYAVPQRCSIKRFMGIWARARRAYIEHTGKSVMED